MSARADSVLALLLAFQTSACAAGPYQGTPQLPERTSRPATTGSAQPSGTGRARAVWQAPDWARHPLMGRCFPTARDFVEAAFGQQGLTDGSIGIRAADPLSDGSIWVLDETPQTNWEWFLLQPRGKSELCVTLRVPHAVQVNLAESEQGQDAISLTQASPGYPVERVRFMRPAGERMFHPTTCTEIRFEGDDEALKDVPCTNFFAD